MLKRFVLALLLACLAYSVTPSMAQDSSGSSQEAGPPAGPPDHRRGNFDPAQRADMLAKHLQLSSDSASEGARHSEIGAVPDGEPTVRHIHAARREAIEDDGNSQIIGRSNSVSSGQQPAEEVGCNAESASAMARPASKRTAAQPAGCFGAEIADLVTRQQQAKGGSAMNRLPPSLSPR